MGYWVANVTGLATGSALAAVIAGLWFFQRLNDALQISSWTVIRRSLSAPATYLLLPAFVVGVAIEQFPATSAGGAMLVLIVAGLVFSGPVLLGMTRLDLWNVHAQLASTAPSTGGNQAGLSGKDPQ